MLISRFNMMNLPRCVNSSTVLLSLLLLCASFRHLFRAAITSGSFAKAAWRIASSGRFASSRSSLA
jgi:hypothetical protein